MEDKRVEALVADLRREVFKIEHERVTADEYFEHQKETLLRYIQNNRQSTNTKLFSMLALLNTYVPNSYLEMTECQKILGPPDPIHGCPPFEEIMEPFTALIRTVDLDPRCICVAHPMLAQRALELLADSGISRSDMLMRLFPLCSEQAPPHIVQFIKELLTKREMGARGREKFSRFIEDVVERESFQKALDVLKSASEKFEWNFIFPQTISRLYYIKREPSDYDSAERWAKKAIERDPDNSYVADTLGQIYKNRLLREATTPQEIQNMARKAFEAFKEVDKKAEKESTEPAVMDTTGTMDITNSFNNRGRFGFMQVAKINFEKPAAQRRDLIQRRREGVEDNFEFFEWYLTYSKLGRSTFEPSFFWRDVAVCYNRFTNQSAADSTSFPGLLDFLNQGLLMSKGRRAPFEENEKTVADLETTQVDLKTDYEGNVDDVKMAERYILSNIILSNRKADSPLLTPVRHLQTILQRFMGTNEKYRNPEFCLLVLLLFWPEENDEEVDQQVTEDSTPLEDEDTDNGNQERPLLLLNPDLQQYVQQMEDIFQKTKYGLYLRGRYLLPLFFLGKGSGLSKWIHKSRLDAIVEGIAGKKIEGDEKKESWISYMWITGKVWQIPEIQDILLPVMVQPLPQGPQEPQEQEVQKMFVNAGGKQIMASVEDNNPPVEEPVFFYLGFNIRGPVLFKVPPPEE